MKNKFFIAFALIIGIVFTSCKKHENELVEPKITNNKVEITATSATFTWTVDWLGKRISMVELSENEYMSNSRFYGSEEELDKDDFSATIDDLNPNTKYYYRYMVWNRNYVDNKFEFEVEGFSTKTDLPIVKTLEVIDITRTSAIGQGKIICDGGLEIIECGICWSTSHNPTTSDSHSANSQSTTTFSAQMDNLTPEEKYYVRAYAKNAKGTAYSEEEMWFVTSEAVVPTVTTSQVTDISWRTAIGGGEVTDDGDAMVTERGLCWNTDENPTIDDNHIVSSSGIGSFTTQITGLTAGTIYYVRAYAKNRAGCGYGNVVCLETKAPELPIVTTNVVTNISYTLATGGGTIISDGGVEVTERGVCWGTNPNPEITDNYAIEGTGTGNHYTLNIVELSPETEYYVRAYVVNSVGVGYGEDISFTTLALQKPIVTTTAVSQINFSQATAIVGGEVSNDGGNAVIERGVYYGSDPDPITSGTKLVALSAGLGGFTCVLTGLIEETKYYVCAYAINELGTSFGDVKSFTYSRFVDMGLPSGTFWATCNVGANNPEDYGDYFAWGETTTKTTYTWGNYKYCRGDQNTLIKYCTKSSYGYNNFTDNLTTLVASDDAATTNWDNGSRIPTQAEWNELLSNTTSIWTTRNGVKGRLFSANNGNSLFIPAAGFIYPNSPNNVGNYGIYWSSSLNTSTPIGAWCIQLDSDNCDRVSRARLFGISVRPVRSSKRD